MPFDGHSRMPMVLRRISLASSDTTKTETIISRRLNLSSIRPNSGVSAQMFSKTSRALSPVDLMRSIIGRTLFNRLICCCALIVGLWHRSQSGSARRPSRLSQSRSRLRPAPWPEGFRRMTYRLHRWLPGLDQRIDESSATLFLNSQQGWTKNSLLSSPCPYSSTTDIAKHF